MTSIHNARYGWPHRRLRAAWAPYVEAGLVDCRRGVDCLAPVLRLKPGEPWDLGHPDETCEKPTAPEHEACNRRTMSRARRAARTKRGKRATPRRSKAW